ncbi:hypothetical protein M9Y10_033515 [Tritrichomonas musculus]|uniref:Uncharacterized protein n=1 Tax=Tritrichomonas musculus TaxID=1915356 RepID=A0ABR2KCB8_9EUKA
MFTLLLPFLSLSRTEKIPKISFLVSSDYLSNDSKEELEKNYQSYIKNLNDSCKLMDDEQKELLEARISSYQGFYVSNGDDINKKISSIPKNTDILFFLSGTIRSSIDFNQLKSQMIVFMISDDQLDSQILSESNDPNQISPKF